MDVQRFSVSSDIDDDQLQIISINCPDIINILDILDSGWQWSSGCAFCSTRDLLARCTWTYLLMFMLRLELSIFRLELYSLYCYYRNNKNTSRIVSLQGLKTIFLRMGVVVKLLKIKFVNLHFILLPRQYFISVDLRTFKLHYLQKTRMSNESLIRHQIQSRDSGNLYIVIKIYYESTWLSRMVPK